MQHFARLLDALIYTPSRTAKLRLITEYIAATPDPDRGWAVAALAGDLSFRDAKAAAIRGLIEQRMDPVLFRWSYDFVGDLAETVSLAWPERPTNRAAPELSILIAELRRANRADVPSLIESWLDTLDATGRWAMLKLITGGLRIGVSARLAKTALAEWSGVELSEIEEVWHAQEPPYADLFDWLAGRAERPQAALGTAFRPLMLAHPLEEDAIPLPAAEYIAEWKWDGIRVQLVARDGQRRVYSRTGDDIGKAFPDLADALDFDAVLDGELLVGRNGVVAPFNDLQQRLNRKSVTVKMVEAYPVFVRLYDMLFDGSEDLRGLPFLGRRARLERWYGERPRTSFDLSPILDFPSWEALSELRDGARDNAIEGLMLKRRDSPYLSGRPKGHWYKWKRGALTVDCVVMYAQRGHGKRSSFYSDYTFGCWRDGVLVPVGKAYSGFTDAELTELDRWVRAHTTNRFGPVREVSPGLVVEVAFDSVHRSTRHKSGVAMRFPRFHRIRWDKPAGEADMLETLEAMIT